MNLLDGVDQTPDERNELLNKWKDKPVEEVLKAKVEADLHIKALEREKAELRDMYTQQREELLAKAKFEELIDRMNKPTETPVANTPAKEVQSPSFNQEDIAKMVLNTIQETESKKAQQTNFQKVQSKLAERYGNNYASVLKEQQDTLGLSADDVNSLAMKSPEAFFRVMGLNEVRSDPFQAPPRSGQRNDNYAPKSQKRDWNYYQELKKTNPLMYLDPKISVQMEKDAQELGAAFGLPD